MIKSISWIIIERCNLNCLHCYLSSTKSSKGLVSLQNIINILSRLKENPQRIFISGGEPLLHPEILEIVEYLKKQRIAVGLCTNGVLITEDVAEKLKNLDVYSISVGIDGVKRQTYEKIRGPFYHEVLEGIRNLVDADLQVFLDFTLLTYNYKELEKLPDFGMNLGVSGVFLKRFIPLGRGRRNINSLQLSLQHYHDALKSWVELSSIYDNRITLISEDPLFNLYVSHSNRTLKRKYTNFLVGCRAGHYSCGIFLDRHISGCSIISKYRADKIIDIHSKKRLTLSNTKYSNRKNYNKNCGKCNNFPICKGCRVHSFAENNSVFGIDPFCIFSGNDKYGNTET